MILDQVINSNEICDSLRQQWDGYTRRLNIIYWIYVMSKNIYHFFNEFMPPLSQRFM